MKKGISEEKKEEIKKYLDGKKKHPLVTEVYHNSSSRSFEKVLREINIPIIY